MAEQGMERAMKRAAMGRVKRAAKQASKQVARERGKAEAKGQQEGGSKESRVKRAKQGERSVEERRVAEESRRREGQGQGAERRSRLQKIKLNSRRHTAQQAHHIAEDRVNEITKSKSSESEKLVEKKGQAGECRGQCKDWQAKPRAQMEAFDNMWRKKCKQMEQAAAEERK